jgi:hypothetical protein
MSEGKKTVLTSKRKSGKGETSTGPVIADRPSQQQLLEAKERARKAQEARKLKSLSKPPVDASESSTVASNVPTQGVKPQAAPRASRAVGRVTPAPGRNKKWTAPGLAPPSTSSAVAPTSARIKAPSTASASNPIRSQPPPISAAVQPVASGSSSISARKTHPRTTRSALATKSGSTPVTPASTPQINPVNASRATAPTLTPRAVVADATGVPRPIKNAPRAARKKPSIPSSLSGLTYRKFDDIPGNTLVDKVDASLAQFLQEFSNDLSGVSVDEAVLRTGASLKYIDSISSFVDKELESIRS